MQAVYDAAQYVNGDDTNYTFIDYKPGEARDMPGAARGQRRRSRRNRTARLPHRAVARRPQIHGAGLGPSGTRRTESSRIRQRLPPASSSTASGPGTSAGRWWLRPAISACRERSPRIPNCSTIWPRASSRTAGRSSGCNKRDHAVGRLSADEPAARGWRTPSIRPTRCSGA